MTPEQIATNKYLIEYRNPDGSLLLPQYGGCWHEWGAAGHIFQCLKCGACRVDPTAGFPVKLITNPNLFTPDGFFALWNAMQAREDWDGFCYRVLMPDEITSNASVYKRIDPLTFPATVEAFLKGLER